MDSQSFVLDSDVEMLIGLLLRKYAKENSDYQRYGDNVNSHMAFDCANRGLVALGLEIEIAKSVPEPKS